MALFHWARRSGSFQRIWFQKAALAVAMILLAPAALAQAPGGGAAPAPGEAPQPGTPASENPAVTGANPEQDSTQNMADQAFIRNTMENDASQIRLSQLAQQKAAGDDVKRFSQQMVKVHTELDSQLKPAAGQMGVSEPKGPSKKEKKQIAQLQGLSGQQFDAAYLEAMAREQQQSIKLFHDETKDSSNKGLIQAAKGDTSVLEQNLQILQKIAQAHNVQIDSKEK